MLSFCHFDILSFSCCLFVFLSRYHGDQMSQGSQVSNATLCVKVLKWRSPTHPVRYKAARAAKNKKERKEKKNKQTSKQTSRQKNKQTHITDEQINQLYQTSSSDSICCRHSHCLFVSNHLVFCHIHPFVNCQSMFVIGNIIRYQQNFNITELRQNLQVGFNSLLSHLMIKYLSDEYVFTRLGDAFNDILYTDDSDQAILLDEKLFSMTSMTRTGKMNRESGFPHCKIYSQESGRPHPQVVYAFFFIFNFFYACLFGLLLTHLVRLATYTGGKTAALFLSLF